MGAIALGIVAGVGCFFAATTLKRSAGYDDSLDVFGVHAVGGIIGALGVGILCATQFGGAGFGDGNESISAQLGAQSIGVIATIIYTGICSFIILKVVDVIVGLRVDEEQESEVLDLALHNERGYIL